jgi:Raf kinase inhibitor-like YbhB/YbcL family protein
MPRFLNGTRYTGDGEDVSLPLAWTGAPANTKELAIVCEDTDAPSPEPWGQWLIYKIPPQVDHLPEALPTDPRLEASLGACQDRNSWSSGKLIGYRGPAPPPGHGTHHYHIMLYALDHELDLEPGNDKHVLMAAMQGHTLSEAKLIGTYQR